MGYASANTHTLKYKYQGSSPNCVSALSREVIQTSSRLLKEFWTTTKKINNTWRNQRTFHQWTAQEKERRKKGKERWINFDSTLVEVGEVVWRLWGKSNGIRQLPEAQIWSCGPTQWISALPITVCVSEDPGCAQYHGVLRTLVWAAVLGFKTPAHTVW